MRYHTAPHHAGFSLTLKRLVLLSAAVAPASDGAAPKLLPLELFSTIPATLSMLDVRLVVGPAHFAAYLGFFLAHLRAVRTADDGGIGMHTVRERVRGGGRAGSG